jgi:hypothetical protein
MWRLVSRFDPNRLWDAGARIDIRPTRRTRQESRSGLGCCRPWLICRREDIGLHQLKKIIVGTQGPLFPCWSRDLLVIDTACLRSMLLLAVLLGMLYRPVQIPTYSNIKVKI